MMCRRGCQPGNNDLLPLLPPTLEALNIAIQEPSTRARGVCKYIISTHPRSAAVAPALEKGRLQRIIGRWRRGAAHRGQANRTGATDNSGPVLGERGSWQADPL